MIMTFGKYRGKPLRDIPLDYLQWVLGNCTRCSPALLAEIKIVLQRVEARPAKSELALPAIAARWYRTLAAKFHPDRGGSHEAMKAINRANDLLLQLAGVAR